MLKSISYATYALAANIPQPKATDPLCVPLDKRQLSTIVNELAPIACNWELLGTCLPHLDRSEVKEIKAQHHPPKLSLLNLIDRWLDVLPCSVCWNDILGTLREPLLNEESLANRIENKVCTLACKFLYHDCRMAT